MANGNQLAFAIRAVNEASAVLKTVQGDIGALDGAAEKAGGGGMSKLGGALGDVAKIAGGFVVANGLMQLPGFLMGAAKGAADDAAATARLEQSLRNAGGAFDDNLAKVNQRIDAGQKLAFGDDAVRDSFQTLLASTGDVNSALERQSLAMDLSRGAGISLESATRMVSKVNDESVDGFRRLGITIKDGATEAEALAAVQAKFAGQADTYATSTAGQFEQAGIRMGELKEQIGAALMPAMAKIATVLVDDVMPAIERFADQAGPKIQAFFTSVKTYWEANGKPALDNLMAAWEKLQPVIVPILNQIGNVVETTFKVISLALGIVVDLLGGDFSGAWSKAKELVKTVGDFWVESIRNAKDLLLGQLQLFKELGGKLIGGLKDGANEVWDTTITWLKGLPGQMIEAVGDMSRTLYLSGKRLIDGLFQGIKDKFWDGIDAVKSMIDPRNWDIPGLSPMPIAMEHAGQIAGTRFGNGLTGSLAESIGGAQKVAAKGLARLANDGTNLPTPPAPFGDSPMFAGPNGPTVTPQNSADWKTWADWYARQPYTAPYETPNSPHDDPFASLPRTAPGVPGVDWPMPSLAALPTNAFGRYPSSPNAVVGPGGQVINVTVYANAVGMTTSDLVDVVRDELGRVMA